MSDLAEGIRRVGFKRWYERQLIESHLYFITAFLCLIVAVAGLEGYNANADGASRLFMLMMVVGAAIVCGWSFQRYRLMLARAVRVAERSTCDKCATYGVLDIARRSAAELRAGLKVKCRNCGHEWHME